MKIDLHTHILPGIDDGARNLEEGLILAESLYNQGIDIAVCTPHYYPYQEAVADFANRRNKAMNSMREAKILLISASETYLHEYLLYNNTLNLLTVENTDYLLLELPFNKKWESNIYETIEKLMVHFNIIPIIAHIERYPAAKKSSIKRLKELGCVMQLNTSSLLSKKLKKRSLSLIGMGLIDVLGSDCHKVEHRPHQIKAAVEYISNELGKSYTDKLIEQSERLIKGIDIRQ